MDALGKGGLDLRCHRLLAESFIADAALYINGTRGADVARSACSQPRIAISRHSACISDFARGRRALFSIAVSVCNTDISDEACCAGF
jgi:hypothetical protein